MASYASATNPFLKAVSPDNVANNREPEDDCNHKDNIKKPEDVDLLLHENENQGIVIEPPFKTPSEPNDSDLQLKSGDKIIDIDDGRDVPKEDSAPSYKMEDLSSLDEFQDISQMKEKERPSFEKVFSLTESTQTETVSILQDSKDFETIDDDSDEVVAELTPELSRGDKRNQHIELIKKLRLQLKDLEKYAYERGELDQVPASVLAERQSVILDSLKNKLSLTIGMDEIETLRVDELKEQIDKEIHDLIDPLLTKEHLLKQLKVQLVDLERYIEHLHKTLDTKLRERAKKDLDESPKPDLVSKKATTSSQHAPIKEPPRLTYKFNDGAAWILHIDKVTLASDSLINLYTLETQYRKSDSGQVDGNLVDSVVRRQLIPAIRDLLSFGLVDPNNLPRSSSFLSMIFDPYYVISTLTCFPLNTKTNAPRIPSSLDKLHVWAVIEEYYRARNEPSFQSSSVKTMSQSFNLDPSMSGPIKITSKQALLIAIEDVVETVSKSKPDGPETHFKAFIYTALNRRKLATWLRLIFRSKSIVKEYYQNYAFVCQADKMDKFISTIEPLGKFEFKLCTNTESNEQYVGAF